MSIAAQVADIISKVTGEPVSYVDEDRTGSSTCMTFDVLSNAYERIILNDINIIKDNLEKLFDISLPSDAFHIWEAEGSPDSMSNIVVIDVKKWW